MLAWQWLTCPLPPRHSAYPRAARHGYFIVSYNESVSQGPEGWFEQSLPKQCFEVAYLATDSVK